MSTFLSQCEAAVVTGNKALAAELASKALAAGRSLLEVIEKGFSPGIREAGARWERGEYFLPELAFSAEAMKSAMEVLQPALVESRDAARSRGTVVIGTVQGDIHDIGKSLVATMLAANGYHVVDLGRDIADARFVEEINKQGARLLCMSALLTTTMACQGRVVKLLEKERLRKSVKVLVGGAPTSDAWAKEIGADGYAENAVDAVRVANELLV